MLIYYCIPEPKIKKKGLKISKKKLYFEQRSERSKTKLLSALCTEGVTELQCGFKSVAD